MTTDDSRSRGITFFDPPGAAPDLMDTGVMSMPVADPPADEQFMGWALSGGHMTQERQASWQEAAAGVL